MAISKIILNNVTQMDITDTTAIADKILSGYTAYGADGEKIIGVATGGGGIDGNNLEYGLIDGTMPLVGVAKVDQAEI